MTPLTPQEMFNLAYLGVIAQGGPSISHQNKKYLYRGPGGRKCGVGHLIDDELAEKIEGWGVCSSNTQSKLPNWMKEHIEFLDRLQGAHDTVARSIAFLPLFLENMAQVAADFSLTLPELPQ